MPIPVATAGKNIWVAAGDGDLERVQELVEHAGISPNAPDPYTYTPMHAAASYGHLHVLDYLIEQGGNVNVTDEDGDTPLYTVENVETARFLVEHGATWDRRNKEGISPVEHLSEEFPEVAAYLESLAPNPSTGTVAAQPAADTAEPTSSIPSDFLADFTAHNMASDLMQKVTEIMQRAEAEGRDPEEELRNVVGETFLQGVRLGRDWGQEGQQQVSVSVDGLDEKRPRREDGIDGV